MKDFGQFFSLKMTDFEVFPISIGQKGPNFSRAISAGGFYYFNFFWISAKVAFIEGGGVLLLEGLYLPWVSVRVRV